ncbi:MAG: tRNA pseudouridine(38-40) synthase TruA [Propionivibrio sp.]|uniref:tRNA pseudouridine synthase A n=1 Tax=Candidatus Propionivibrio dominans TaxID=2954373 RepID=A0A9D7FB82_9RHOO|nr:tRNA pseudouridine(38-40) synthase TruA [Candidatus Propionivibrio dominans]
MRIALGVEYDGSAFHGWQKQPRGNTVQDALQAALSKIAGLPVAVVCAGRTDAGVHATAQVVHFDTRVERPLSAWVRGTNTYLPAAVAVRWAHPVTDDFHARFSAYARCYRYLLINRQQRTGVWHGRAGWYHHPLDVEIMQQAAAMLLGEHDFSAFRAADCQARTPVRTIRTADVQRSGEMIVFDFEAGAYLHHMVRNLVGSLVYVGQGKHPPEWIGHLLTLRDRRLAAPTFPAAGLYLVAVRYQPLWGLPVSEDSFLPGISGL